MSISVEETKTDRCTAADVDVAGICASHVIAVSCFHTLPGTLHSFYATTYCFSTCYHIVTALIEVVSV